MTKQFDKVIAQVKTLPTDRQDEAAALLLDFVDREQTEFYLSPEQIAEIERRLSDDEAYASDEEVQRFFERFRK